MAAELGDLLRWVEGSPEEVFVVTADARVVWANQSARESLGYSDEELTAMRITDIAPSIATGFPERFARTLEGTFGPFRTVHFTKTGERLEKEVRPFHFKVSGVDYMCAFVRAVRADNTEARLRQLTRLYQVLSLVSAASARATSETQLFDEMCRVAAGPGAFRMAWVGLVHDGVMVPAAQAGHVAGYLDDVRITTGDEETARGPTGTAVRTGELDVCSDMATASRMTPWRHKALTRGYLSSAAVPLRCGGKVIGALTLYGSEPDFFTAEECTLLARIGEDMSLGLTALEGVRQRELLRGQLERARRLEAIGRVAGGVGHDFNNLLSVILVNAEHALFTLPEGHEAREDLEQIIDVTQRSARLTRELLQVARQQPAAPHRLELDAAITSALSMVRKLVGPGVEVVFTPGDVGEIDFDPTHLDQVLTNLAANARDALEGRGHLWLETRRVILDEAEAERLDVARECVALSVRDDGPGMTTEVLEQLFEPFFTTKKGRGTGLGLATVYGLVRQAGGVIEACSTPGEGATFRVLLPLPARAGRGSG